MKEEAQSAIQDYLDDKIQEHEFIFQLDALQAKMTKEGGVIYTPLEIVHAMIELANPHPSMTIIEPSCGHGAFIFALINHMRQSFHLEGETLLAWFKNHVTGVEISHQTVLELQECLSLYFFKHFSIHIESTDFSNIVQHDSLTFNESTSFDLCIGNPPYVRAKHLEPEYLDFLKKNFASCAKGTVDIYFAFIEKYLHQSHNMVFITPNSFLNSKAGQALKAMVYEKLDVLIDFKERLIFPDARVYTCIFKTSSHGSETFLYGNHWKDLALISKSKEESIVPSHFIHTASVPVLSGIATLADSVFHVEKIEDRYFATLDGQRFEIESGILAPYLKLTKTYKNQAGGERYMIFPYRSDKSILSETDLNALYPKAYQYLLLAKPRLMQRDKGKTEKYEAWYAYGRKQGLHVIDADRVIAIPQMIGGDCLPHEIDLSLLKRQFNTVVFTSGFLVPRNEDTELFCQQLLSLEFRNFARNHGKPFPGKMESYYNLNIKQIRQFSEFMT